jgi:hypothetical protein
VEWPQIAGAKVIIETSFVDRMVEPSQGSHFFHNITSHQIGYLTIRGADRTVDDFVDFEWLDGQPARTETPEVRHVRLDEPFVACLDGRRGRAIILKPGRVG